MCDPPDDEVYVSPEVTLFIYPHALDYIELENEWISKVELAFIPDGRYAIWPRQDDGVMS